MRRHTHVHAHTHAQGQIISANSLRLGFIMLYFLLLLLLLVLLFEGSKETPAEVKVQFVAESAGVPSGAADSELRCCDGSRTHVRWPRLNAPPV